MANFNAFGSFGLIFTQLFTATQAAFALYVDGRLDQLLREHGTRSRFLWDRLVTSATMFGRPTVDELRQIWTGLEGCFQPRLMNSHKLATDTRAFAARQDLMRCRIMAQQEAEIRALRMALNAICYGPFTEEQLAYVVVRHPRLVEIGCGTGYAVSVLRERGVDAVGVEPGNYRLAPVPELAQRLEMPQVEIDQVWNWSERLRADGALIEGSVERIPEHADRTLLISWPEPGSDFPVRALRAFREAGGTQMLFKLGGFVGIHQSPDPNYRAPANPGANITAFFSELSTHWTAPAGSGPAWEPELLENNLLEFRLKSKDSRQGKKPKRKKR